jgi:3-oxoacyl-(acyl-carrier-protein) synthase
MSGARRVVITGLGQVSSLGSTLEAFEGSLFAGRPGVRRLSRLEVPGVPDPIGANIPDFDPGRTLPGRNLGLVSLGAQYAHAAAFQAIEMAGLERAGKPGGLYVGTGFGGIHETENIYRSCFATPPGRPRPGSIPTAMANAPAGFLAAEFQLKGPNLTFSVACASATHAIGEAFRVVRSGEADLMLAGGVDAPLTPIVLAAWGAMRILAPAGPDPTTACRPFSADRSGIVVGEGAGFLVLESLEAAQERDAPILAELAGYGRNADGGHPTHPDPQGVRQCLSLALDDGGVTPHEVGYVNAHGTGTHANDSIEAEALADILGERESLLVSSTKAVHGHVMGASGAIEAIATVRALGRGRFPPTGNLLQADPALPRLGYIRGEASEADVRCALSNSFAFGGNNAVLVFRRTP